MDIALQKEWASLSVRSIPNAEQQQHSQQTAQKGGGRWKSPLSRVSRYFSNNCRFRQWIFFRWLVLCCWFFPSQWLRISHKTKEQRYISCFLHRKCIRWWKQTQMYLLLCENSMKNTIWSWQFSWLFVFSCLLNAVRCCSVCSSSSGYLWPQQHVPRGSTAAQGAGWVRGGQAVVCACSLLGRSVGCLSTWNCAEITSLWFHRSPARAAVWELASVQTDSQC